MADKSGNDVGGAARRIASIVENVENVIVGKHEVVAQAVSALLSEGHVLVEDVPGVGKTMLAKAIARSIDGEFKRIQFTADLLPSDVTGVNMYEQHTGSFRFRAGPVFANVLLGDEINRGTPRTQSSLLEAMEEAQVTVDGHRHGLRCPFFVMATQNPIELEGTYPLPFAQMDRFIIRLRLGYLDADEERRMVRERIVSSPIDEVSAVVSCDEILALQRAVREVRITEELLAYAIAVVQRTRSAETIEYGASPRASLDLVRYAQASALSRGRGYVLPDDVKHAAPGVLAHRLIVRKGTRHATLSTDAIIADILNDLPVPV